jgi:CRISPR/Cas system-associated exonuclease Cas4 (RecB family)
MAERTLPRPFPIDFGRIVATKAEKKVEQKAKLLEIQTRKDLPDWFVEEFERDLNLFLNSIDKQI